MGFGDELMVSGEARRLQQKDPRKVRIVYGDGKSRWNEVWNGNPRIAQPGETGDFQVLEARIDGLRPYAVSKSSQRWVWREYRPPPGEIYFTDEERDFGQRHAGRVILEPHVKGGSPNKAWGWIRWNKLAWLLARENIRVTQVGPPGTPVMEGAEYVVTENFRGACAVLAGARAAVLPEGGLHHAAAALGIPAVVIFGAFIAPAVTGYDSQVNIFRGEGLGCGNRRHCSCCRMAMVKISPEEVAARLLELLRVQTPRNLAA